MRTDVKNLLEQIGQPDFPYQETETQQALKRFGYWPLFEAVALHPAISRRDWIRARQQQKRPSGAEGTPAQGVAGLFAGFEDRAEAPAPAPAEPPAQDDDVRGLLRRLSGVQW